MSPGVGRWAIWSLISDRSEMPLPPPLPNSDPELLREGGWNGVGWDGMGWEGGKVVGVREVPSAARNIQRSQWHSHALHPTSALLKLQGGPNCREDLGILFILMTSTSVVL